MLANELNTIAASKLKQKAIKRLGLEYVTSLVRKLKEQARAGNNEFYLYRSTCKEDEVTLPMHGSKVRRDDVFLLEQWLRAEGFSVYLEFQRIAMPQGAGHGKLLHLEITW